MADFHVEGKPITSKVDYTFLYEQAAGVDARTLEFSVEHELVETLSDRPFLLSFNTFYYPGWHAYLVDAETDAILEELPIALRSELGLMTVRLPAGLSRVLLQFEPTPVRRLGTALSLISLLATALLVVTGVLLRSGQRRKG
jgi:hypothetical protein